MAIGADGKLSAGNGVAAEAPAQPDFARLARLLTKMAAKDGARTLSQLGDSEAATVLAQMPEKPAAQLLAQLPPERTAALLRATLQRAAKQGTP